MEEAASRGIFVVEKDDTRGVVRVHESTVSDFTWRKYDHVQKSRKSPIFKLSL